VRTAIILACAGFSIATCAGVSQARSARHTSPLSVERDGCSFSPPIQRVLASIGGQTKGKKPGASHPAHFDFAGLHGVAAGMDGEDEWSGAHLFFREDLRTLRKALRREGFRVDANGVIASSDDNLLFVGIGAAGSHGPDSRFPGARSYLACGSL
jgi:hypothetical protein